MSIRTLRPRSIRNKIKDVNPGTLIPKLYRYYSSVPFNGYITTTSDHIRYKDLYQKVLLEDNEALYKEVIKKIKYMQPFVEKCSLESEARAAHLQIAKLAQDSYWNAGTPISFAADAIPHDLYKSLSLWFTKASTYLPSIDGIAWVPTFIDILFDSPNTRYSSYNWHFDNVRPGHIKLFISLSDQLAEGGLSLLNETKSSVLKKIYPFLNYPRLNLSLKKLQPELIGIKPGQFLAFDTHNLHRDETLKKATNTATIRRCWSSTQCIAVSKESPNYKKLVKLHESAYWKSEGVTLPFLERAENNEIL